MPDSTSPHVNLAKEAVRHYLERNNFPDPPGSLGEEFDSKAGVFVSIKKSGQLRGCVGTLVPTEPNLAKEIIRNAIHSATQDPRFPSVKPNELSELTFSVDVLTPAEKIENQSALDCKKYGLILRSGDKQGVLLPDIAGVSSVEEQIQICRKKAGLKEEESAEMYRFEVKRHK